MKLDKLYRHYIYKNDHNVFSLILMEHYSALNHWNYQLFWITTEECRHKKDVYSSRFYQMEYKIFSCDHISLLVL